MNKFIYFQIFRLLAYLDKCEDKYPSPKKNKNDAIDDPNPK